MTRAEKRETAQCYGNTRGGDEEFKTKLWGEIHDSGDIFNYFRKMNVNKIFTWERKGGGSWRLRELHEKILWEMKHVVCSGQWYSTGYLCVTYVGRSRALTLLNFSHGHMAVTVTRLCSMVLLTLVSLHYSRVCLGNCLHKWLKKKVLNGSFCWNPMTIEITFQTDV